MMTFYKKIKKSGITSAILVKKYLILNLKTIKKYRKTKVNSYEGKVNTILYNDKIPKEGSIVFVYQKYMIDSAFKVGKNYYP